jgi:sugar lactone lactonase YvrE
MARRTSPDERPPHAQAIDVSWFGPAAILAECPRWDEQAQRLSWVDIDGGVLHVADLEPGEPTVTKYKVGSPLAGAVLTDEAEETWLVAIGTSLAVWSAGTGLGAEHRIEAESAHRPLRLNEMVTDPIGRLWIGSMAYDWTSGAGSYFRIDLDGTVTRVLTGITVANGVGWSPDGSHMYTTDTGSGQIVAWDYDLELGLPSNPSVLIDSDGTQGRPDGLAIDVSGNIWSAFAGGHHISCFSPSGKKVERLEVPAPAPTSCCFAGPERDRLLVTSTRKRLSNDALHAYPDSGRIWDFGRIGVAGTPQPRATVSLEALAASRATGH